MAVTSSLEKYPRIMITAGEASGDLLGAGLASAILARQPQAVLFGMGGAAMAGAGVRLVQDSAAVSVVGLFEVLSHLPVIREAMERLKQTILDEKPDILVPVDFPDFNLRLATWAASRGVRVVYYVSPQVWAWRRRRVHAIRKIVDRMLVLFPFEARFYEEAGVPVTFVGHPVAERVPVEGDPHLLRSVLAGAGLSRSAPTIALLPGSRTGEVDRILPFMLDGAKILAAANSDLQFLVSSAPSLPAGRIEQVVSAAGLKRAVVHTGDFPEVLRGCRAGVVASGTATLEAAMTGLPMVVVYRMNLFSHLLGRMLVHVDHVAMPNLVAGERVLPELIQGDCNGSAIAAAITPLIEDCHRRDSMQEALRGIRGKLEGDQAYARAAAAVLTHWVP